MATTTKKNKPKRKSAGLSSTLVAGLIGILGLGLTLYIGYRASTSGRNLFSVSLLALLAGLFYESLRITDNWKNVVEHFVIAYFFSFVSFLKGKRETVYSFENHIEMWPYSFLFMFCLTFGLHYKDKVTAKLTEGITLLQSIALIYWTIDVGFINLDHWLAKAVLLIALLLALFSIFQALTYYKLSRTTRLTLSIWSTIIMVAFAVDNVYSVYHQGTSATNQFMSHGLYLSIQYFLLGVSAIYITQNFMLLLRFLPEKNGNYKADLKQIKKDHITRYSDKQVLIGHSILGILYGTTLYALNHSYHFLPRQTMIWLVFVTFPLLLKMGAWASDAGRS